MTFSPKVVIDKKFVQALYTDADFNSENSHQKQKNNMLPGKLKEKYTNRTTFQK